MTSLSDRIEQFSAGTSPRRPLRNESYKQVTQGHVENRKSYAALQAVEGASVSKPFFNVIAPGALDIEVPLPPRAFLPHKRQAPLDARVVGAERHYSQRARELRLDDE